MYILVPALKRIMKLLQISLKHFTDDEIVSEIDAMVPDAEIMEHRDAAAGE